MFLAGKEMMGKDGGRCVGREVGILVFSLALTNSLDKFGECL